VEKLRSETSKGFIHPAAKGKIKKSLNREVLLALRKPEDLITEFLTSSSNGPVTEIGGRERS